MNTSVWSEDTSICAVIQWVVECVPQSSGKFAGVSCCLLVELPCVSLLRLSSAVSCYCDGSTLPGCLLCVFKPSRCFFSVSLLFALFSCVLGRFYAPVLRRLFVVSLSPVQRLRFMALVSFWKLLWCKSFFPTELPSCHDKQRSRKLSHVSSSD